MYRWRVRLHNEHTTRTYEFTDVHDHVDSVADTVVKTVGRARIVDRVVNADGTCAALRITGPATYTKVYQRIDV